MNKLILPLLLILCVPLLGADKDKSLPKDFKSLKALAEEGDAEAQNQLANRYYWGKGVNVDKAHSFKWASRSAKQNNPKAKVRLAWLYYEGGGVPQDTIKAQALFKESKAELLELAKRGNANTQLDQRGKGRGSRNSAWVDEKE